MQLKQQVLLPAASASSPVREFGHSSFFYLGHFK